MEVDGKKGATVKPMLEKKLAEEYLETASGRDAIEFQVLRRKCNKHQSMFN